MFARYRYRLYPTATQQALLAKAFGCARRVFNDGLRARLEASANGLPCPSRGALSRMVITQAKTTPQRAWLADVSTAMLQQALIDLDSAFHNYLRSLGRKGKGRRFGPPRFRSRKDGRQAIRFARNAKRDWQHKLSTRLVRDHQAIYVEDLNVAGLIRCRTLAKSIHDAGWSQFARMLEYKAARDGRTFVQIDRFEPSTRRCSSCGVVGASLPLSVRSWTCACGAVHDRDVNAAMNILAAGRADKSNACGAQVRPVILPAPRGEAGIRPSVVRSQCGVEGAGP